MNVGGILQRHSGSLKGWTQGVITHKCLCLFFFPPRDYLSTCISRSLKEFRGLRVYNPQYFTRRFGLNNPQQDELQRTPL